MYIYIDIDNDIYIHILFIYLCIHCRCLSMYVYLDKDGWMDANIYVCMSFLFASMMGLIFFTAFADGRPIY